VSAITILFTPGIGLLKNLQGIIHDLKKASPKVSKKSF
jgi:hypothetical protein